MFSNNIRRHIMFFIILNALLELGTPISRMQARQVTQSDPDFEVAIIKVAAETKIREYPALVKSGYRPFQAETIKTVDGWAFLNLASYPTEINPNIEISLPTIVLAIAYKNPANQWDIFTENTSEYYERLDKLPETLVTKDALEILRANNRVNAASSQQSFYNIQGLPWAIGESWRYNQGPHDKGSSWGDGLDFGTPVRGQKAIVRAADQGVIIQSKETCIIARRSDGLELIYQHIEPSDVKNNESFSVMNLGDELGYTTLILGCDAKTNTGHHVHFAFRVNTKPVGIQGFLINGWLVKGKDQNGPLSRGNYIAKPDTIATVMHTNLGGIGGIVKHANGTPAFGIFVTLFTSGFEFVTQTSVGGTYSFSAIPSGTAVIGASDGEHKGEISFEIQSNRTISLPDITLINLCSAKFADTTNDNNCNITYPPSPIPPPIIQPANVRDDAAFTGIESPADNFVATPNQAIHKTWRVKNTGNRIWGPDHKLVFTGGNPMGAPSEVSLPVTAPGGIAELGIDITAPATGGSHRGNWELRNPQGTAFGDKLWVSINVNQPNGTQSSSSIIADPPAPSANGAINFRLTATNFPNFRAIRFLVDNEIKGESGDPLAAFTWNTNGYAAGDHSIVIKVADQTDTNWEHPLVYNTTYTLTGNGGTLNRAPTAPRLTSPYDWYLYYSGNTARLCAQETGDPDGDAIAAYYFEILESAQNWSSGWVSSSCVETSALGPYGYQWHAKVRDVNGGESDWSERRHFTLVNPNLEITQLAFEPQDGNGEKIKIRACSAGQGGVGITLRVRINEANDGSGNGLWHTIHELGVPCYNDTDAPNWYTLDYADGPHLVRVEAHGSSSSWNGAAAREAVYTLPARRPGFTTQIAPVPASQNRNESIFLNSRTVTFQWQTAIRAADYTLHVSTSPEPQTDSAPIFRQTFPAGTTAHTVQFDQAYPTLYWRVTTTNNQGSNDSYSQLFGIDQSAPSCVIQSLPLVSYENVFQLAWSPTDALAGVRTSDIQVRNERDGTWQDWLVGMPATKTFDLFNGQPGEVYQFRCRSLDQAGNQGSYSTPSSAIRIDPTARPTELWWNSAYTQKRTITLLNNMPNRALPVNYPLHLRLDSGRSPSSETIFAGSMASTKCDDLRIVHDNTTELARYIPVCRADLIDIWFPNQATLDATATNNAIYRLYYGNSAATNPSADQAQMWSPLVDGNTVGLWFLSEGSGTTLTDFSGYGNTGNPQTMSWVDGKFGKALFSASDERGNGLFIPGNASLGSAAFTLDFFVKRGNTGGGYIAGQGKMADDRERMRLRIEGPGTIAFQIDPFSDGPSEIIARSNCLPDLEWHHVAVTFDGNRTGAIYCDGALAISGLFNGTGASHLNFDLYVGSDFTDAKRFVGTVDQVRFSNIVRTEFPHAQFAKITIEPTVAVGEPVPAATTGAPDLTILGLNTYPNPDGGVIVEALVQNQGDRETQNSFYTDLYIDHLPTGVGDYTGSAQFWVNGPIAAGATITLTAALTDFNSGAIVAAQSQAPAAEATYMLYMQTDSTGAVPDVNKGNNILSAGVELCFANPDAFEGDNEVSSAVTLLLNQVQPHNFSDAGDQDWVKFSAEAGKEYTFRTRNLGAAADTYLYLYDTDGITLLTANDDGNDTLASQISWVAPAASTYYLLVRHWNPNVAGCGSGYELIAEAAQSPGPTPTFTPTPVTPQPITPTPTSTPTPTPTSVKPPAVITYAIYLPNIQHNSGGRLPVFGITSTPPQSITPTPTQSITPTPTQSITPTPTQSITPTPTQSITPTPTQSITPTPTQSITPTPTSIPSQLLAYASSQNGNFEIYKMYNDGSEPINLTNNAAYEWGPNWSPDGNQLAFVSERDGNLEIYVMNADGSDQRRLTNNTLYDAGPTWSLDGQWLAYKSYENGDFRIYLLKPDGSMQTLLTTSANNDWRMSWSPDGQRLAFSSYRDGNGEIYLINSDGTGLTRVTTEPTEDNDVTWSPDGERIAFVSKRDGNAEIYVMNIDGSNLTRLTNNPAVDSLPIWSPDGKKLAFTSHRDGFDAVYLMNADGSAQTRITNGPSDSNFAVWRPK